MKKSILKAALLSMYLFYGCSNTDNKLNNYIESHCNFNLADTCYINLKDALNIEYDKMYFFVEYTSEDEISEIMGIPYSNTKRIHDSEKKIILLKNDKVVYDDTYYPWRIYFSLNYNMLQHFSYDMYTTQTFKIIKRKNNSGRYPYYYMINPVE